MAVLSVALTGNPNVGKSTIFNELTGARQKIGNWPGVTVDKKVGYVKYKNRAISIMDLPGTYSINARSPEEQIVTDYLTGERPDIVVDIIDAANIERNLFLTLQIMEMGIPIILDLNMMDEAKRAGVTINMKKLGEAFGMPVVETVGRSSKSIRKLLDVFDSTVMESFQPSSLIEEHVAKVNEVKESNLSESEKDEKLIEMRYAVIDQIVEASVVKNHVGSSLTEKIDNVLANSVLALPMLLLILYLMFQIAFTWGGQPAADALGDWIGEDFTDWANDAMAAAGVSDWLQSLISDGIIAGVGNVVNFVPLIFTLFFMLSFLDGTGYMARVAFVLDPIMRRVGLTGKGIMPLMMGFGCGVPAIMGARALDSEKDRMTSILITPFLTCSAKLPILALFAAMFFPDNAANVVFAMYVLGVVVAIVMAKVLGLTAFKDKGATFLLELPPYRIPAMKTVLLETWDKGKGYLVKAGTIIFAMSVMIWFLSRYNFSGPTEDMDTSFLAYIGNALSYLFVFHGFSSWESGAAIFTGIAAKESVVSTMGIIYGVGEISTEAEDAVETAAAFQGNMSAAFTAASALAFMVFSQLYTPCMTAQGTTEQEAGSWKWMFFSAGYTFVTAWVVSLIVYWIAVACGL